MRKTHIPPLEKYKALFGMGLVILFVLAFQEANAIWTADQSWDSFLTPLPLIAIFSYGLLLAVGMIMLASNIPGAGNTGALAGLSRPVRWIVAVFIFGLLVWVYLFSPWQSILVGPWLQFLVATATAYLLAWLFAPHRPIGFGGDELVLALAIFLYPRIIQEIRIIFPFSLASRAAIMLGFFLNMLLIALLYGAPGQALRSRLLQLRRSLGRSRYALAGLFLLTPLVYRYALGAGGYILYPSTRFLVLLLALWMVAFVIGTDPDRLVSLRTIGLSAGAILLVSAITRSLLLVVDNPFSLSWSEGNRLYDYSIVFGQDLYNHSGMIPDPYGTPGRYGLWGILFLFHGLPIWVHRLWNVVLLTLPSFILSWALTRRLQPAILRQAVFLWITALFIVLAPLHPPFMLVAIVVAVFAFHRSPYVRGASLIAASLYAGLSRWTWVFAPGAWGALIDLFLYYPARKGPWLRRLYPAIVMTFLGVLPGFLLNIGNFLGYSSGELATAQQPLLWYRLLPNATLGPGILLLMLVTTGPLLVLLAYLVVSRRWDLDGWQLIAVWGALIGFLAAGLVISTKIGGGGDLHNLDMYIATLALVMALGLSARISSLDVTRWPVLPLALLCFLLIFPLYQFTPFYSGAASHPWLNLPDNLQTETAMASIRSAVDKYSSRGEVLFMDQRQLLTFGYVKPIPLIYQYEKKYMMDQAMAANAGYFALYYQDLAKARFSLIVTELLRVNFKGQTGVFSEENDAWVTWVSAPTLCFYEPIMTDKVVGVQLLVPKASPRKCEKYLQQAQP
jgi:hypothetical protein